MTSAANKPLRVKPGSVVPAIAFGTVAARTQYEQASHALKSSLPALSPAELSGQFTALESRFDAGTIELKTAMLTSGLFSNEDDQALGAWVYRQHAELWEIGTFAAARCRSDPACDASSAICLLALAFLHAGEVVKWELMVGRHRKRDYHLLHTLMRSAIESGRQRDAVELTVDGLQRKANIESLYFRTLLLDRFANGNLTRPQIEVLDAWLWEWTPSLTGKSSDPDGEVLRADLDSDAGLRHGVRLDKGPSLYLELAPLEDCRKAVIKEFHRGRVFPPRGRAASIRIEAHVAVLLALRTLLSGAGGTALPRAPRTAVAGTSVELFVGLADIAHGLGSRAKHGAAYDRPRRTAALMDASATGFRCEVAWHAVAGVGVGELVGVAVDAASPLLLTRIVRRVDDRGAELAQLGLQLLSNPSQPVRLATLAAPLVPSVTCIFVPGADGSGRFDSFAIPLTLLSSGTRYHVQAGSQSYTLVLNHVRRRGQGWVLAGFEIVEVGKPPASVFELTPAMDTRAGRQA